MQNLRKLEWLLACLLLVCSSQGCGDDSDDQGTSGVSVDGGGGDASQSSDGNEVCDKTCEVAVEVNCSDDVDICHQECLARWNPLRCTNEFRAALSCAADIPLEGWECDENDESNLKAGYCESEVAAVSACVGQ